MAIFDCNILPVDISGFSQSPLERCHIIPLVPSCTVIEQAAHRHRALLRVCRERPGGCCTTDEGDELPPFHSITSSARASHVGGRSRPSALAVLRLMARSYLVGACTGSSAG